MIATTLGLSLILSQSAMSWQDPVAVPVIVNYGPPPPPPLVYQLQQSPRWWQRDRAAIALRQVDWRQAPGTIEALSFTATNDPNFHVRKEANRSLAIVAPTTALTHATLSQTAATDPCWLNRLHARKALRHLPPPAEPACGPCEPPPGATLMPGAVIGPSTLPPPATEVPALPPPTFAPAPGQAAPRAVDSSVGPAPEASPGPPPAATAPAPGLSGPSVMQSNPNRSRLSMFVPRIFRPRSER